MIDPILFSLDLGFTQLTVRWYGVLIVLGTLAAAYYASWYIKRKGQDPNIAWDMLIWVLISGIVGARAWYVIADIIGGNSRYLDDPVSIVLVNQGGLNILGGMVVATVAAWYFAKRNQIDFWLLADAVGPGFLIGQAIGRWGNFINQELYGPPTGLPWGVRIEPQHRIAPWNDLTTYPFETTAFHPTFFYEMIWNLVWAGILIYFIVRNGDRIKTGIIAGSALLITAVGRILLEIYFRPDQPNFFGFNFSTSLVVSVIFGLVALFIILVKSGRVQVPFMESGSTDYAQKAVRRPPIARRARR